MSDREPERIIKIGPWELWGVPRSEDDPIVQQRREMAKAKEEFKQAVFDEVEPALDWLNENIWFLYLWAGATVLILVLGELHILGVIQLPDWLAPTVGGWR